MGTETKTPCFGIRGGRVCFNTLGDRHFLSRYDRPTTLVGGVLNGHMALIRRNAMGTLNRRNVVIGTGMAAGCAAFGATPTFGVADDKEDPKDVLQKIKLVGDAEKKFVARMGRGATPVVFMPAGLPARKDERAVEPTVIVKKTPQGAAFALGLSYLCDPRVINAFVVGGNGLTAKRFAFSISEISWAAGNGWPVYTTYCPRDEYDTGMYYRDAKVHQIVPSIKGQNYFIGCLSSAVCESPGVGQICFAVNDNSGNYADNSGYFTVNIWSWS
jgi:hypothetical protein